MILKLQTNISGQLFAITKDDERVPINFANDGHAELDKESNRRIVSLYNLREYRMPHSVKTCFNCGVKFIGSPKGKWCGRECLQAASAERIKNRMATRFRNLSCITCGLPMKPHRRTRKFCSGSCRQKAHRDAKAKVCT